MSITRIMAAIQFAERTYEEGEPVTVADLELDYAMTDQAKGVGLAIELHRAAVRLSKAAQQVEKATATQLADALGDGGAVRYGDTFYRYNRGWTEKVIDVDTFWQMAKTLDVRMSDIFNPNTAKKGSMPEALRDTAFTRKRDDNPKLVAVPADKAPLFLQELEDGDFVVGKR